jgi:CheY-like chemotaxis protein
MGKNIRIFVVEDHPTTARALKMYLETQDYVVTVAENVASALKAAAKRPFDLLICDLNLPDGTGWDLMKKLSSKRPIRGIAFTASGSDEDIARSRNVGFIKHLMKGCPAEDLTKVIEQVLKIEPKMQRARPVASRRTTKP